MRLFLIVLFFPIVIIGCSILGSDSETKSFDAEIGNKSFKGDAYSHISTINGEDVIIGGSVGDRSYRENISFGIVNFESKIGVYELKDPSFIALRDGDIIEGFARFDGSSPSVTITKYDTLSKKIDGNFKFELTVETPFNDFEKGEKLIVIGNFSTKIDIRDE